jgi:hypothetical protein
VFDHICLISCLIPKVEPVDTIRPSPIDRDERTLSFLVDTCGYMRMSLVASFVCSGPGIDSKCTRKPRLCPKSPWLGMIERPQAAHALRMSACGLGGVLRILASWRARPGFKSAPRTPEFTRLVFPFLLLQVFPFHSPCLPKLFSSLLVPLWPPPSPMASRPSPLWRRRSSSTPNWYV